jgi:hypothetical protein
LTGDINSLFCVSVHAEATADAINKLNGAIEMLNKKSEYLEKQIHNELVQAKVCLITFQPKRDEIGSCTKEQARSHAPYEEESQVRETTGKHQRPGPEPRGPGLYVFPCVYDIN